MSRTEKWKFTRVSKGVPHPATVGIDIEDDETVLMDKTWAVSLGLVADDAEPTYEILEFGPHKGDARLYNPIVVKVPYREVREYLLNQNGVLDSIGLDLVHDA